MIPTPAAEYKLNFVLLLGSFDRYTKRSLEAVKKAVVSEYGGTGTYCEILDSVEIFTSRSVFALSEKVSSRKASIFVFTHEGFPIENYEITGDISDNRIQSVLKENHELEQIRKLPVMEKLDTIFKFSSAIIVLRHREETRGGEIAESVYAMMRGHSPKVCMFKKEGFRLSTMVTEFLNQNGIALRTYDTTEILVGGVLSYLSYIALQKPN